MKQLLRKVCLLLTAPLWLLYRCTGSKGLYTSQGQFLALIPGKIGSYLRVAYYHMTLEKCPCDGYIGFGSYFPHPEVELGTGVFIGGYCIIGMSRIGDHATIASFVSVLSGKNQHGYQQVGVPIQDQSGIFKKVTIGENCWIGNAAVIMADLGKQNVVAAGSVVIRNSGDYEILSGNPATVIKKYHDDAAAQLDSPAVGQ